MALPLLVFGPRSLTYDFGPSHPLTPRRFGPGIDLLREVGAEPGLAPEPASDDDLLLCHSARYIATVKRLSELDNDPWGAPEAGIGPGDDPPFAGMHEAAAAVAGGSLRAIEAIIRGDLTHAFHPGGGLHHAMPSRASGFCIYNDPALAIAKARQAGMRVLYIDLDVHHGDGVEEIHRDDPGVLTVSFHEDGRYLFPGTGSVTDVGDGPAAGSVVNVPLEPETGERAWLSAVETLVPELASAFGPDIVVSQHGCDTHAWDPLAHLNVTTTAMGAAARVVDAVAHRWAGGRWLATGGGGYGVYRVVPRAWAHVWLAAAHREPPDRLPDGWRIRWAEEAARYGDRSLPETFDDSPNAGLPFDDTQRDAEALSLATAGLARLIAVPRLVREAVERRWWSPLGPPLGPPFNVDREADAGRVGAVAETAGLGRVEILGVVDRETLDRLVIAPRLVANLDPQLLRDVLDAPPLSLTIAVDGISAVGIVASAHDDPTAPESARSVLAVGVAPAARRHGLATQMLQAHVGEFGRAGTPWTATVTLAERDPVEPLDRVVRSAIATRIFERAGFTAEAPDRPLRDADPGARRFVRS
jgi:acetoin utilization protein AcuC